MGIPNMTFCKEDEGLMINNERKWLEGQKYSFDVFHNYIFKFKMSSLEISQNIDPYSPEIL